MMPPWNLDPTTAVTLAAIGGGMLFFLLFLVARLAWDRRQARLDRQRREWEALLPEGCALELPLKRGGWGHRFDAEWERMAEASGLGLSGPQWLLLIMFCGLGTAAGLYLYREDATLACGGMVLGCGVPLVVLWLARQRLRLKMQQQLPDALFFLARGFRAGLSFEQAMQLVATETPQPLAREWARLADALKMGLAPAVAVGRAAERVGLPDFHVFAAVLRLHTQGGGNLALLLDRLAATTRDRNQYLGYFRSATALGRTTAIAIGSAVPLLFLGYVLFEPEYANRFFASSTGLMLLGTAFGLELIGIAWLYLLLRVES